MTVVATVDLAVAARHATRKDASKGNTREAWRDLVQGKGLLSLQLLSKIWPEKEYWNTPPTNGINEDGRLHR